jgi:hypothetical protein
MNRIHLFEFEDQGWFPQFLRNYVTDFLQFLSNKTKIYKPIIPIIKKGLLKSNTNQIIDLASGGGGGLLWLNKELQQEIPELKITLSDFYPNISAFELTKSKAGNFDFLTDSIDARNVPSNLTGLRTQFLSFHHFKPEDAKQILQNAINTNSSIAVFEVQERSVQSLIAMLLSPVSVILSTPFIRPFKIGRILFTYLIPIVPLIVLWDGVVSSFRTYSVKEMNELVTSLEGTIEYDWEIGKAKNVLYLLGTKKTLNNE